MPFITGNTKPDLSLLNNIGHTPPSTAVSDQSGPSPSGPDGRTPGRPKFVWRADFEGLNNHKPILPDDSVRRGFSLFSIALVFAIILGLGMITAGGLFIFLG